MSTQNKRGKVIKEGLTEINAGSFETEAIVKVFSIQKSNNPIQPTKKM